MPARTAVVALGGNAISRPGETETIHSQFANTRSSLGGVVELIREGYRLVISHGNGPQVGAELLRVELGVREGLMELPLGVLVADTEGGMGYMIAQSLQNRLHRERIKREVACVITQVVVDRDNPSVHDPTKFVGPTYSEKDARKLASERGWRVKQYGVGGWRRVVPSPIPIRVVESETIRRLVRDGTIVVAVGGGGVPVYEEADGTFEGVDAVIDKDRASAVLGRDIGAELLVILTAVDRVSLNYGTDDERPLDRVPVADAKRYLREGHFPPGSMGPKIEAAISFIESGGKKVIVTSLERAAEAVLGTAGTTITN
jgi:carbamate kinase